MTGDDIGREWTALADAETAKRESDMRRWYAELASRPEAERSARLESMVRAEYELDDARLRQMTVSRLRAWLNLPPEQAQAVVGTFDRVMDAMPANDAMRRVAVVQKAARDLPEEDQLRIRELAPRAFSDHEMHGFRTRLSEGYMDKPAAPPPKKPWWKFWAAE